MLPDIAGLCEITSIGRNWIGSHAVTQTEMLSPARPQLLAPYLCELLNPLPHAEHVFRQRKMTGFF